MAKKKTFVGGGSPALQFFSDVEDGGRVYEDTRQDTKQEPEKEATETTPIKESASGDTPPKGFKRNPEFIECRTRRVQLVMQPSLHEKAKKKAKKAGISLNEFVSRAIEKAVE